jgi:NADH-quinone oxidoreductase subunit C
MQAQEIFDNLKEKFGDAILEVAGEAPSEPYIKVAAEKIFDISLDLRDDEAFKFDYLMCLSGMDLGDNIGVVYHLYSTTLKHTIVIKLEVAKDGEKVPTVERVWRAADWHEREAYDMLGVEFEGHHNMIRILCPYDWEGYPLRKDYKEPDEYHGMKVPY